MGRRAKPAKRIGREPQRSLVRKSSEEPSDKLRDLEKRLAEALEREADALKREAEALGKLQTRDRELAEALERQNATAEILRAISQSPTDFQPVFETILVQAVHLCAAEYAAVFRFDGSMIHFVASYNLPARDLESVKREYPMSPTRSKLSGRAILSRGVQQVADILADAAYEPTQQALEFGVRSILAVPMVRSGEPVGAVLIYRRQIGLFPDTQVALLQTFADQAFIVIHNVPVFTETKEALERQTATSEILRVISSSPTDTQPVF